MKNFISTKSIPHLNEIYLHNNYLKEQFLQSLKNSIATFVLFLSVIILLGYLSGGKNTFIDGLDIAIALVAALLMLVKTFLKKLYSMNKELS